MTRGGRRVGAGRKPDADVPRSVRFELKLTPAQGSWLEHLATSAKLSRTAVIEAALDRAIGEHVCHECDRGQPRTERITLALTETERAEIEAAVPENSPVGRWIVGAAMMRAGFPAIAEHLADRAGLPLSEWIRSLIDQEGDAPAKAPLGLRGHAAWCISNDGQTGACDCDGDSEDEIIEREAAKATKKASGR